MRYSLLALCIGVALGYYRVPLLVSTAITAGVFIALYIVVSGTKDRA